MKRPRPPTWHLPAPHALESWSDIAAPDGTISLVQPLIRPLHPSCSAHRLLALMGGEADRSDYDRLREFWRGRWGGEGFEDRWRKTLVDGVVADSRPQPVPKPAAAKLPDWTPPARQEGYAVVYRPDPSVFDGRFANNAWLQECPQPFTKAVWGNAIEMAPEDAARREDRGRRRGGDRRGRPASSPGPCGFRTASRPACCGCRSATAESAPARSAMASASTLPSCATALRPGSRAALRCAASGATDGSRLRPRACSRSPGEAQKLAPILRPAPTPFRRPRQSRASTRRRLTLAGDPYAWAMVIDTDACIGCNACVVACQSENNVPSIGPDEIRMGRDMHWLRIDVYDHGAGADPSPVFQPVPCMHCETAPCEPVCPVEASVHDHEGLNVQVYNRCVGTRFCESNCPYKVRRFNFFGYADGQEYGDLGDPLVKAAEQSGRQRARARRDGEMHLLRPAHQRARGASPSGSPGSSQTAKSSPPAKPPARRRRSASAISPTRIPPCRTCGTIRDITRCWKSSTRGRERPISRASRNSGSASKA